MIQGIPHVVRLVGPTPVPFRFRIAGSSNRGVLAEILSDANGEAEVRLEVGHYVCYAENLSRGSIETTQFSVSDDDLNELTVQVGSSGRGIGVSSANLRPSRATLYRALNSLSGSAGDDDDVIPVVSPRFNDFRLQVPAVPGLSNALAVKPRRRFSVGLSVDTTPGKPGGWRAARAKSNVSVQASAQKLLLEFSEPTEPAQGKARLSLSVEGDRVWQIYLPFFSSGLRATISPTLTDLGPELTLQLNAIDPSLSLVLASTLGSYPDGLESVTGFHGRETMLQPERDPWSAIALGLSAARAGDYLNDGFEAPWTSNTFDYISDAHVLWAWAIAAKAEKPSPQIDKRCLAALTTARKFGRPYFSATGEIVGEMLNALALSSSSAEVRSRAKAEAKIWANRGRAKIKTGPFYSWERPGANLRNGKLPAETYGVLVSGHVTWGNIEATLNR